MKKSKAVFMSRTCLTKQRISFMPRGQTRSRAQLFGIVVVLTGALSAMPLASHAQNSKKKSSATTSKSATDGLRSRVRQLEGQLLDMQVMIGTLQTLARSGGGGAARGGVALSSGGADGARIRSLETQVQALTAMVERLSQQVQTGRRSDIGSDRRFANVPGDVRSQPLDEFRQSSAPSEAITGFGATTVTPGADSIGKYLDKDTTTQSDSRTRIARAGGDSKQLYETAYGYLLQQNFKNAQSAFSEFLELYPNDPLAGNAQYWLGETFYVRRKFRAAANAFLKGYQEYGRSTKAPDNLLKLSMSLDRLGQKEAACSSYLELQEKFPRAPAHVRNKAGTEIRRLKC